MSRRRRWSRHVKSPLRILLAALGLTVIGIGVVGQIERLSRVAEAPIEIVGVELQVSHAYQSIPRGWNIRYRFEAGGRTINGAAFRNWSLETIRSAKVCYDPSDPQNQLLVPWYASCPNAD